MCITANKANPVKLGVKKAHPVMPINAKSKSGHDYKRKKNKSGQS